MLEGSTRGQSRSTTLREIALQNLSSAADVHSDARKLQGNSSRVADRLRIRRPQAVATSEQYISLDDLFASRRLRSGSVPVVNPAGEGSCMGTGFVNLTMISLRRNDAFYPSPFVDSALRDHVGLYHLVWKTRRFHVRHGALGASIDTESSNGTRK